MKKKSTVFILCIIWIIALVIAFNFAGDKEPQVSDNLKTQEIYYVEKENSSIKPEYREIQGTTFVEKMENALIAMATPPKAENLAVAIPQTVEILSVSYSNLTATVDVSESYMELITGQEMFCRAAIVWTLTSFYFVDGVKITVEGKPLLKTNGEAIGAFGRENLIVDAQIEAQPTNYSRILTLYFVNKEGTALVKEQRKVEVNPNQPIERYVIEQLILGPTVEGNIATVPPETKIRDIQTQDGICYLDLSQDFVTKHQGGTTGETFTIYSIVNSLAEIATIEKVQFLIEGEKQDEFKGHLEFGKPFEPMNISEE